MAEKKTTRKKRLEALERFMFCPCDGVEFSKEQKEKFREANEMLLDLIDSTKKNE